MILQDVDKVIYRRHLNIVIAFTIASLFILALGSSALLIHFIGKDNIVFHCLIFPSMLKAHGDYILPTNVPANELLNLEGGIDAWAEDCDPAMTRY